MKIKRYPSLNLDGKLPYTLISPVIIFLIIATLYPTIYLIYISLTNASALVPRPSFLGFLNYLDLMTDNAFRESFWHSVFFVLISTGLELVLGMALAILLNKQIAGLGILRTLIILPMVITPVVVGLTWMILYDPTLGIINYFLSLIGIQGKAWIAEANTALWSVILVDVWQWTPFMFLILTAGLQGIPIEILESSEVDGATKTQQFLHITLPIIKPIIGIALLFRLVDGFKTFDTIFVMTRGGPGTATQVLPIMAYLKTFSYTEFGYGAAIAVFILLIINIVAQSVTRLMHLDLTGG